jgi:hypothetical protein
LLRLLLAVVEEVLKLAEQIGFRFVHQFLPTVNSNGSTRLSASIWDPKPDQ